MSILNLLFITGTYKIVFLMVKYTAQFLNYIKSKFPEEEGKMRILLMRTLCLIGIIFCAANAFSDTIQEIGVNPLQVVTVHMPGGHTYQVYAGAYQLLINGVPSAGYCIDYTQWAPTQPDSSYVFQPINGPIYTQIAWIMQQYNPATSTPDQMVNAQIAIWLILAGNPGDQAGVGDGFYVDSWSGRYGSLTGVLSLITQVQGLDLRGFDTSGFRIAHSIIVQDYITVPEPSTLLLLGGGLISLAIIGRKKRSFKR